MDNKKTLCRTKRLNFMQCGCRPFVVVVGYLLTPSHRIGCLVFRFHSQCAHDIHRHGIPNVMASIPASIDWRTSLPASKQSNNANERMGAEQMRMANGRTRNSRRKRKPTAKISLRKQKRQHSVGNLLLLLFGAGCTVDRSSYSWRTPSILSARNPMRKRWRISFQHPEEPGAESND